MTRLRRLLALMKKETLQVRRDPSCILIAFVLPVILLFIFGYGLSLDSKHVRLGFVMEDRSPTAQTLRLTFKATDYIDPVDFQHRAEAEEALVNGRIRGLVVLQNDFSKRFHLNDKPSIQLITDGVETNTATILESYVIGTVGIWSSHAAQDRGLDVPPPVDVRSRVFFNPELNTRNSLIPGSIVLIMSIIGTLLTSLVVAREWERGTMEAMLATPIGKLDMILGKLVPYYVLGISSTGFCTLVAVFLFGVPFRGTVPTLFVCSSAFLLAALALGFLISTATRNQFLASQLALMLAFLPNMMLSGAIFEIASMPPAIQAVTYIFPARYYVSCLQSIFMAGDIMSLIVPNTFVMLVITVILFAATVAKTPKGLE